MPVRYRKAGERGGSVKRHLIIYKVGTEPLYRLLRVNDAGNIQRYCARRFIVCYRALNNVKIVLDGT
jgi:DNA-directed RNA polymerase subunit N (RpoN/RPB10)